MYYLTTILIFVFSCSLLSAQDTTLVSKDTLPDKFYLLENVTREGETMPEIAIDDIYVRQRMGLKGRFKWWRHRRLVYNVKKVYPYSILVRTKLEAINDTIEYFDDEKELKKYLKKFEKDIFKDYEGEMRKMTITQGRILIKLIDRETKNTSYILIKNYRGSITAVFWQGIARIFGTNLKAEYDPGGEDYLIELVIQEIEAGTIK